MKQFTLGSLFDGISGFSEAGRRNDIKALWASEIAPFPMKVAAIRFPDMEQKGDITKIIGAELEPVDIVTGGSPCQDLSVAGKRAGLAGAESGLFMEMIRIVEEMLIATNREYPKAIVWENVPGAFSSNQGEDIKCVLYEFERLGLIVDLNVLDAQYLGVPQRRRRIYAVCLNANYIRKMKTNISWSIITQLLTEILLCILNGQLNLYEKEPKDSVWKQKKLTEDGLQRKMKLFGIEEKETFEKLLKTWIETSQTLLKGQYSLGSHSSEESDTTIKVDIPKSGLLMEMETEKQFGSTSKSWKQLLDVFCSQGNLFTTSTVSKETTNQIIYGCANLLENTAWLTGQLKNCYPHLYETALFISTGRKECIKYARARQTSGPLFEGMEWFYNWDDYIDKYSEGTKQLERYFRTEPGQKILLKREGLSRHLTESGKTGERITANIEGSVGETIYAPLNFGEGQGYRENTVTNTLDAVPESKQTQIVITPIAIDSNCQDSRFKLTGQIVPTIPAKAGTGGNNGPMLVIPINDKATRCMGGGASRNHDGSGNGLGIGKPGDPCPTLTQGDKHAVCAGFCYSAAAAAGEKVIFTPPQYSVRRLTPLECERLQDYEDGWTDIPGASDSGRYKACGNSVAVCCPEYVLEGIKEVLDQEVGFLD